MGTPPRLLTPVVTVAVYLWKYSRGLSGRSVAVLVNGSKVTLPVTPSLRKNVVALMERGLTCIAVLNVTVMGAVAFAPVELSAGSVETTAGGSVLGAVVTNPKTKFLPRGTAAVAPRGLPTRSVTAEEIVAVYVWSDWRFASGVNVATLFAGSMATTPVTAPATPASVKVVFETPVTGSLNVAVSALFAGTLMS